MERSLHEFRARVADDGSKRIVGYAATYNSLSRSIPTKEGNEFRERLLPGCFNDVLASRPDVVCLLNHDQNKVLGRTSSGTLTLNADERGLAFDCTLGEQSYAIDAYEAIKRGDLRGCSFAFNGADSEWDTESWSSKERGQESFVVRTISRVHSLLDCSVVASPAYEETSVAARSLAPEIRSRFFASPSARDEWRWRQHPSWRSLCNTLGVDADSETFECVMTLNEMVLAGAPAKRRRNLLNEILDL